jgi:hypothetical protein
VSKGQPQNAVKRIVLDIGTRQFEGNNPGLSYTAFGRATQLGDPNDITTSALFLDGPNATPTRFMNITQRLDGKGIYKKVALRQRWVEHLKQNVLHLSYSKHDLEDLFLWAETFKPDQEQKKNFHSIFVHNA